METSNPVENIRSDIPALIGALGVSHDTILRLIGLGAIKGTWKGPRRFKLQEGETAYLRKEWPLVDSLRASLRTEPLVRAAILFGSHAKGTSGPDSDIDLFLVLKERVALDKLEALRDRLSKGVGGYVDLYADYEIKSQPLLLRKIAEEGRPIISRQLDEKSLSIKRRAVRANQKLLAEFAL